MYLLKRFDSLCEFAVIWLAMCFVKCAGLTVLYMIFQVSYSSQHCDQSAYILLIKVGQLSMPCNNIVGVLFDHHDSRVQQLVKNV